MILFYDYYTVKNKYSKYTNTYSNVSTPVWIFASLAIPIEFQYAQSTNTGLYESSNDLSPPVVLYV
jgi:hypothetical protein